MAFTDEEVTAAIKAAVEKNGSDYVYVEEDHGGYCYNHMDGTPACIVGHVLDTLGMPPVPSETQGDNFWVKELDSYRKPFSHAQCSALSDAQEIQDKGGTWGKALAAFEYRLSEA